MKKLIFSAIAMIAFAGGSMANTVEIIEEKIEVEETCLDRAITFLTYMDPDNEMDQVEANDYFQGFIESCYRATGNLIHKVN